MESALQDALARPGSRGGVDRDSDLEAALVGREIARRALKAMETAGWVERPSRVEVRAFLELEPRRNEICLARRVGLEMEAAGDADGETRLGGTSGSELHPGGRFDRRDGSSLAARRGASKEQKDERQVRPQGSALFCRKKLFETGGQPHELRVEARRIEERVEADFPLAVENQVRSDRNLVPREIRLRVSRRITRRHFSVGVQEHRKGELRPLRILLGLLLRFLHVDDDYRDAEILVLLEERFEMRSLRIAEGSPTGAEVQHHQLALQVRQGEFLSFERREAEGGRRLLEPELLGLRPRRQPEKKRPRE